MLKPKVGTGDILEETPNHLPNDDWDFHLKDILCGPLEVTPHANQFLVKIMMILSPFNIFTKFKRDVIYVKEILDISA